MEPGPARAGSAGRLMAVETRAGCVVLSVRGELDLATETGFVADARRSLGTAAGRPLVIDLSALTFLSSAGVGHLVQLDARARKLGTPLRIVVGDAWAVFGTFAVLRLDEVLSLHRTVADALAASPAGPGSAADTADPA